MAAKAKIKSEGSEALGTEISKLLASKPTEFAWKTCQDKDALSRIIILEKALEDGLQCARNLANSLKKTLLAAEGRSNPAEAKVLGTEHLQKWITRVANIEEESRGLEVLVGVAGATGAGKTSFLNALLGFKDLLPPDNSFAATATICKILYNYDMEPNHEFRATVHFRDHADVRRELEELYENLEKRRELEERRNKTPSTEDEDEDDESLDISIRELNSLIKDPADKVKAVWGYTMEQLKTHTPHSILSEANSHSKFIGTTKRITCADRDEFSEKLVPYLKTMVVESSSGTFEPTLALWPLIRDVEVYIRSDILKSGIVLVDLPGLSDVVASRAKVASDYYDKLAITVIVTPVVRAADEQVAVNLMDKNMEVSMRMNDRMNSRNFCVVLSKTDDIEWQSQAKRQGRQHVIREMDRLQKELDDVKEKLDKARLEMKKLRKEEKEQKKKGAAEPERNALAGALSKCEKAESRYKRLHKRKKRENEHFTEATTYNEIGFRNEAMKTAIQSQLKEKCEAMSKNNTSNETPQEPVPVFPVSTKAFWLVQHEARGGRKCITGFPKARYTGVPEVSDWLRWAAIPQRERHVTMLLNRLNSLLDNIETWSNDECKNSRVRYTKEQLEKKIITTHSGGLNRSLASYRNEIHKEINAYNPLRKGKEAAVKQCSGQLVKLVSRFIYTNPQDYTSTARLHWLTHLAIIKREGRKFISRSKGQKVVFDWMETLAIAFKEELVEEWLSQIHREIPNMEQRVRQRIGEIWDRKVMSLCTAMLKQFPQHKAYLIKESPKLFGVKDPMEDRAIAAILNVSAASAGVHAQLPKHLQEKWRPAFNKAKKEKGRNSMKARQSILKKHASDKGETMYTEALSQMNKALNQRIKKVPQKLNEAWVLGIEDLQTQLHLIIDNIIKAEGSDKDKTHEEAESLKSQLQDDIRWIMFEWVQNWSDSDFPDADLQPNRNRKRPQKYEESATGAVKCEEYDENGLGGEGGHGDDDDDDDYLESDSMETDSD